MKKQILISVLTIFLLFFAIAMVVYYKNQPKLFDVFEISTGDNGEEGCFKQADYTMRFNNSDTLYITYHSGIYWAAFKKTCYQFGDSAYCDTLSIFGNTDTRYTILTKKQKKELYNLIRNVDFENLDTIVDANGFLLPNSAIYIKNSTTEKNIFIREGTTTDSNLRKLLYWNAKNFHKYELRKTDKAFRSKSYEAGADSIFEIEFK